MLVQVLRLFRPAVDLFATSTCCAAQPLQSTGSTCLVQVDPSVPLFGYIGRLEEQKGVDILMAALPKALAGMWRAPQHPRWCYACGGLRCGALPGLWNSRSSA